MYLKAVFFSVFLFSALVGHSQGVTIIIESLPSATPESDTIFITGSFNNWLPNDKAFMVTRMLNGQLGITLPSGKGQHEFKFTRGSWTKVETTSENQYTQNRILNFESDKTIYVTIENWLDLGGAQRPGYSMLYFFACAFQGLALLFLIFRIQKREVRKVQTFSLVNGTLVLLLVLLVLLEIVNPIWQSYITFIFQIALFCWAPLLFHYQYTYFTGTSLPRLNFYFVPAGIALLFVVLRLLNISALQVLSKVVIAPVTWANAILIGSGFLFTGWVHMRMIRQLPFLKMNTNITDPKLLMLRSLFWISVTALVLIPVNVILLILGVHQPFIDDFLLVGFALSLLIFLETYYLWRFPEIFKEEKVSSTTAETVPVDWIDRLNKVMRETKPYKNPDLNVSDLAEIMGIKAHVLSRGINDHYQKNFRDFVNSFRIEEFIALADTKEFKHYTFLALAQEVGFNSKSTFNLAFKKFTDKSPREYFKNRPEDPE